MLELDDVTVHFGQTPALDAVRLRVDAGQIVCVLGPSGSGKSTMLRVIAGLQEAAGTVRLAGRDLRGVPTHRRDLGLMFQDHVLFGHRDVGGNVEFGLRMRGMPRRDRDRRVEDLLELVGLPGARRRRVDTLSGGEQQRVALARALAPRPKLLMLDEPLGQLDRALRERLTAELRAIFRSLGTTVLAVTHDQGEAFALADHLVVMGDGRVLQSGAPRDVWARPASARVARFLGFTNVATAEVSRGMARTPWADLRVGAPVPPGRHDVLVRPDAVRIDPGGPVAADVVGQSYRGDHVIVTLAVPDAPPLALVCAPDEVPSGLVRVRIDPGGLVVLPTEVAAQHGT